MIKQYSVEITETLQKVITVAATSEDDALEKVIDDYRSGNIILDADNFVDYEIKAVKIDSNMSNNMHQI